MHTELLSQRESGTAKQPQTILVVDDDEGLARVLCLRLEQQGYQTVSTGSGKSGLALAHERHPHLIVLDLRLPDVEGLAVCEQLVDSPSTSRIPVIILSGMSRPDIIRSARAAGCRYFVRKPYDPNALLLLIQHAIAEELGQPLP